MKSIGKFFAGVFGASIGFIIGFISVIKIRDRIDPLYSLLHKQNAIWFFTVAVSVAVSILAIYLYEKLKVTRKKQCIFVCIISVLGFCAFCMALMSV